MKHGRGVIMTKLNDILSFNENFVENKEYASYISDGVPSKKIAIITCMDARLIELINKAMNIKNGDAKMIKTAGAQVDHPYGSVMRSLLVAVYALKAEEVFIVGHRDCGMNSMNPEKVIETIKSRGIDESVFDILNSSGINVAKWLEGFTDLEADVENSVNVVRNHPLIAKDIPVHGLIIDPKTGKLDLVTNGYNA